MRLLVVGCAPQTRSFFQDLGQQPAQQVTFCPSGRDALAYFHRGTIAFDWLIIADLPESETQSLIGALRAQGIEVPVILCQQAGRDGSVKSKKPFLVGLFERSEQGLNLVGCNLATAGAGRHNGEGSFSGEILYEYHAPCCK